MWDTSWDTFTGKARSSVMDISRQESDIVTVGITLQSLDCLQLSPQGH